MNKFRGWQVALFFSFVLFSCAGSPPKPVDVVQSGDYNLTCSELTSKINSAAQFGNELRSDETGKWKKNIGLAAAGGLLIFPYFFMDLTEGDDVEINAAKARYIHLHRIAVSKSCEGFDKNEPILDLQTNLRRLNLLFENGTITKEEYIQKREQLIRNSSL